MSATLFLSELSSVQLSVMRAFSEPFTFLFERLSPSWFFFFCIYLFFAGSMFWMREDPRERITLINHEEKYDELQERQIR
jgi:hypothetical protein